ncbi:MAG: hypothetical protein SFW09_17520 [Hyphomicrobiaceae bacterium]|nr:hypothetical protein [Hyphomicrobiaceae bacterium]
MPNKKKAKTNGNGAGREHPDDAVELLSAQQERVRSAAEALVNASDDKARRTALEQLATLWTHYSDLEHEVAFKAYSEAGVDEQVLAEATIGHDLVAILMGNLLGRPPGDPAMRAGVAVLGRLLEWRSDDTEKTTTLQAAATEAGVDMKALGKRLRDTISSIEHDDAEQSAVPYPRLLRVARATGTSMEERIRTRGRERDQHSRYIAQDDDRRAMRSRQDGDDERGRSSWSRGASARGRDDYGGFTDEDEDRSYSSRSRRDDEEDRGRRSGGWFGDREGHSRAAGRSWDERRSSGRSDDERSSRYHEDRRSSSSRRDDDDDDRSRLTRYRQDDDEGPGWHGDSEGHAEAARKGWEHRRRGDDDDQGPGRSSARSRDEDDDRYRGRSSGWFGDREGHRRAAERGWDERRISSRQGPDERSSMHYDEDDDRRPSRRRYD